MSEAAADKTEEPGEVSETPKVDTVQSAPETGEQAKPDAPKPDPELAAKLKRLEELERAESEREKAKLSEAEKVARERQELALERYRLDLEKAGLPKAIAMRFRSAPEKNASKDDIDDLVTALERADLDCRTCSSGEDLAAVKAAGKQVTSNDNGRGGGTPAIDPARRPAAGEQTQDENARYRDIVKQMRQRARGA
ncbi:MAG: hypothetical protein VW405_02340 [Rhodospirillaceae bacterium]